LNDFDIVILLYLFICYYFTYYYYLLYIFRDYTAYYSPT